MANRPALVVVGAVRALPEATSPTSSTARPGRRTDRSNRGERQHQRRCDTHGERAANRPARPRRCVASSTHAREPRGRCGRPSRAPAAPAALETSRQRHQLLGVVVRSVLAMTASSHARSASRQRLRKARHASGWNQIDRARHAPHHLLAQSPRRTCSSSWTSARRRSASAPFGDVERQHDRRTPGRHTSAARARLRAARRGRGRRQRRRRACAASRRRPATACHRERAATVARSRRRDRRAAAPHRPARSRETLSSTTLTMRWSP